MWGPSQECGGHLRIIVAYGIILYNPIFFVRGIILGLVQGLGVALFLVHMYLVILRKGEGVLVHRYLSPPPLPKILDLSLCVIDILINNYNSLQQYIISKTFHMKLMVICHEY